MTDMPSQEEIQRAIAEECDNIKSLLITKNNDYGSSFLNPSRTFSRSSALEQIRVRMDDKLSRLKNLIQVNKSQHAVENESVSDTKSDLIGYLILEKVAEKFTNS